MAVYFRGMSFEEVTVMTDAMMRSGDILDFSDLGRPTADKHSTGGIGDKVSLPLAPLVASTGVAVPMISGRGLGLTGGTLDKLDSIPGYRTDVPTDEFRRILAEVGCSIIGQTARLAPADRKLYALRDVTGTVPSIPLIASSILSKKLAEGAGALVLDVKCGEGAFMRKREDARRLADTMVAIGRNMGRRMSAFVTAMDQPLGRTVGNALEVRESIETLRGNGPDDIVTLTVELGAEMLVLAGVAPTPDAARQDLRANLASGAALEVFARMVAAHGGNAAVVENPALLPQAAHIVDVPARRRGYVASVSADAIGRVVLLLGGGRKQTTDRIDYAVGVDRLVKIGDHVDAGVPLMRIHCRDTASYEAVAKLALEAVAIGPDAPAAPPLIYETLREARAAIP
jgi:pyrimidine-nucleoside phosphorylase